MNKNKNSIKFFATKYLFLIAVIFVNNPLFANNLYNIDPYIELSTQTIAKNSWLPLLANTTKENELFFTNTQGEIYRSQGEKITASPFLELAKQLESQDNILFTAITLHPNFHLDDQLGKNVIYTAHIEQHNPARKKGVLLDNIIKSQHTHDAVITEWQLSNINKNNVSIFNQREVLRIATNSVDMHINQLSFNPFVKSWSDDFGLLYISLKHNTAFKNSALYSGSILRIKPNKFGLLNYTIPHDNPFTNKTDIANEIVITGAQNIDKFSWSKYTKNQLILTHTYNSEQLITISSLGSNYIQAKPKTNIYKNNEQNTLISNVYYKNRELNTLWNKLVLLTKNKKQWQISSMNIDLTPENLKTPNVELNIKEIPLSAQLSIHFPGNNELLLWDKSQGIIYKLMATQTTNNTVEPVAMINEESSSNTMFYLISFVILISLALAFFRKQYNPALIKTKSMLRSNLARFEFDTNTDKIRLFKRHENKIDTEISIQDIVTSEILLNNTLLNQVSHEANYGFNDQKESMLRIAFEQEHRDKMIDDKVRKISLKLTTIKAEDFIICVYLREGNQRFTKEKYHDVMEKIIDWQWYLSEKINAEETPKRIIKPKMPVAPKPVVKLKKINKPTNQLIKNKQEEITSKINSTTNNPTKVDTKLIDALNKLVTLKEQGYLTEEEFTITKNNLLENLADDT